ncbi:MAG: helix-turn-helix transcriptional regulator [Lachnospiraceae bacterium]|nr:helix-turn-helix transcriptional regulator [Lachnospiraceae bacterium]
MTVGERIKERRLALKMSQQELADKLGYTSRSTINKIENDANNLRQPKIMDFAKALKTTPGYLMGWEDKEESEHHYIDEKTRQIAQEIADNKELGLLFDAARTAAPEDLKTTHDMLLALKRKEQNDEEPC